MTTYTIAYDAEADLLIACAPDGAVDLLDNYVKIYLDFAETEEVEYHHGLTLTNELHDGDEVVYSGKARGHLIDTVGTTYFYAVHGPATTGD